jgi:hypothetical protein
MSLYIKSAGITSDISLNFTLSDTIPNSSLITTGFNVNYNGSIYDIAKVYNNSNPIFPHYRNKTSYLTIQNDIKYDISQLLDNYANTALGRTTSNGTNGIVNVIKIDIRM